MTSISLWACSGLTPVSGAPYPQISRVTPRHPFRTEFLSQGNPELIAFRQSHFIPVEVKPLRHHQRPNGVCH